MSYCKSSLWHALQALPVLLLGTVLNCTASWAAPAGETSLAAPAARITDEMWMRDQTVYRRLEERLKALNDRGYRLSDYSMAKAQCWIDVSYFEYTGNDRSDFPRAALEQGELIIAGLEAGQVSVSKDTPLVNGAARIRSDLWARLEALKAHPRGECAAQATACAEVELVHAGNEAAQFGWLHANPTIEMAEDLTDEAEQAAARCPVALATTAPAPGAVARTERLTFGADTLFAFGRGDLPGLSAEGRVTLDTLIVRLRGLPAKARIEVVGFSDRIDVHHRPVANLRLSEARAKTVADYLASHGLDGLSITSLGRGPADPLVNCPDTTRALRREVYACLAPNRRVEVRVIVGSAP